MFTVYMHKNKSNGKVYIGYTGLKPAQRWGKYGGRYLAKSSDGRYKQEAFAFAILKYGWDNFEHIIIKDDIATIDVAQALEQQLIAEHRANESKYGYNMTNGGEGTMGKSHTEVTKKKISLALTNPPTETREKHRQNALNRSKETREKISESLKGRQAWNKGKNGIYSQDTLNKMSERAMLRVGEKNHFYNKHHTEETKNAISDANSIKIYCIELNRVFPSVIGASRELNINRSSIFANLRGRTKSAGGYHWQYVEQ